MPASGHALTVYNGFRGLPGVLLGIGYSLSILAGIWGIFFEAAPPSVQALIGFSVVSILWNLAFIGAGLIGLVARWYKAPLTEIIAIEMFASVFLTWAVMVFEGPQSNQAGIAFVALSLFLYGWSAGTRRYLAENKRDADKIREV
jgi:hypothetical protein